MIDYDRDTVEIIFIKENQYKEKNKWSVNFCLSSIISYNFLIEL